MLFGRREILKEKIRGIKGWDICPSINQGPIRARPSIGNRGDP